MTEITGDLLAVLADGGVERTIGGNTPFLLDRPDTVWLVRSGRVEVFSVAVENGAAKGARYHFFTADPGDVLFGMDLERYGDGQGLLAVGMVGTQVVEIPYERLRAMAGPATGGEIARLVERWVLGISAGVARSIVPHPRGDVTIVAGRSATLADGKRLRTPHGVAWVRHETGSSLFVGMEDLGDIPAGAWFPLTPDTWLQSLGASTLVSTTTSTALAEPEGWSGLEGLYALTFRCEFFNTRLLAADELNRLTQKAERDRHVRDASLRSLASVLEDQPETATHAEAGDALFAACTLVGGALGIEMKAPPRQQEDGRRDPLAEIVRASRVRTRRVVLKGEWWRQETGPLLAYLQESNQPVAILPGRTPGRLDLADPVARTRQTLTSGSARTVNPVAYSFYKPFPDRRLTLRDLVQFGLINSGRDLARPILVGAAAGALATLPPYLTGLLVDSVIPESSRGPLVQIALVLGLVALVSTAFDLVRNLSILRLQTKITAAVQPALWDRLLGLPAVFFRRFTAGDLAWRVNAVEMIRQLLSGVTLQTLMTSVFSFSLLVQMFSYNARLALFGVGVVAVVVAVLVAVNLAKLRYLRQTTRLEGETAGLVLQLLTGIARLRVTGAENHAFAEWARKFSEQRRLALRSGAIDGVLVTFNSVVPVMASLLLFYLLIDTTPGAAGAMTAGDFVAFTTAFGALLTQMVAVGMIAMPILQTVPLYERVQPILDSLPEVDLTKTDPGEITGRIELDHVTFRYHHDGPIILNDVTLQMHPGEFVAIVGPSGSGKSTLLRLLLGLDHPESGSIYYDGKNLALLDVQKLRRRIGVVMQTGKVRGGSIFDNIVGSAPLTIDDAWEAARLSGFDEDVRQMPMQMHTVLQQGGVTLSGGQRQRLMIARAIIHRPRVLFFDEATSALDNRTQAIVSASLQELQATRVAIAHRLSTVVGADRIYVLAAGRVVQTGSYAELIAQPGMFADLVRRQML